MGAIRPQDGDHHGNGAHDVQGDEAGGAALQLESEKVLRLMFCLYGGFFCIAWGSYLFSSINAGEDLRQQGEQEDDAADDLKQETRDAGNDTLHQRKKPFKNCSPIIRQ